MLSFAGRAAYAYKVRLARSEAPSEFVGSALLESSVGVGSKTSEMLVGVGKSLERLVEVAENIEDDIKEVVLPAEVVKDLVP